MYVSQRRDIASARRFFTAALTVQSEPAEVITDRAPALANVIEELVPAAWHNTGQYENNRVESDHGRLKARLRPMRGIKTHRTARRAGCPGVGIGRACCSVGRPIAQFLNRPPVPEDEGS